MEIIYIIVFLLTLFVGLIIINPVINLCKKLKVSQTTLHYVEMHSAKSGTPTMGGIIFLIPTILCSVFFFDKLWTSGLLCLLIMLGYGLLGFLDDFIKVKFHQNEGLKPYQKIIGQFGLAIIVALYVYFYIGTSIDFFGIELNFSWLIIPFVMLVLIATTNSVNLTDGLDGLAGGVSFFYLIFFGIILAIIGGDNSIIITSFSLCGGLLAFLTCNCNPAKIFMGDTGSLALGGFIACSACLTRVELLIPIIGVMFVVSSLSDIIQVLHYKRTKRRVFLMAPFHHHLEMKGVYENRIVVIYILVTIICGLGALLFTLR